MYWLKRKLRKINWSLIANLNGYVLICLGLLMVLPTICSLIYKEDVVYDFLITIAICLVVGFGLSKIKRSRRDFFARDGMIAVGLCWITASLFGGLPYFISQEIPSYVDCFFEAVSGFTTTGSSIVPDVTALSKGILFWRSFTHWIGGMGILVFIQAFIPKANERSMHIIRAESPGPIIGKLVPRIQQTAAILYSMYMGLTILCIVFLLVGGMPLFDTLCYTFGTAGTGGFSISPLSVGEYNNLYYEIVITVFMLLFGINFNLYYFLLLKKFKSVFKSEELRTYLFIVFASMILIALNISKMYGGFFEGLRYSSFQVATIISTTGYATTDFNLWPMLSKSILLCLMVVGACAGSTAGGIKVSRFLIILKKIKLDIQRLIHPQKVSAITMDGKIVDEVTVQQILTFFGCFILILLSCILLVSLDNLDFETTISSVFTCIGNVGPAFGLAGPMGNFAMYSDLSKIVLSVAMLVGRLEIYPILIFLFPLFKIPDLVNPKKFYKHSN
ncbi:trk system potassium uptake protein TrkH [Faecalicoccus acidiformans]|uniref:Trk system potassium uptake protein TrkH n=1 Tax=Faecalicoccus acidiformans TaxID=915173 RepID=A0A7W8D244_9FIRM|nr:TrkH family potassium uptake protein [Faecalicoccus acidiformans]MBB5184593.1 trk system potassium uptake protein TrkH [Faecalicoccus acidiformans]